MSRLCYFSPRRRHYLHRRFRRHRRDHHRHFRRRLRNRFCLGVLERDNPVITRMFSHGGMHSENARVNELRNAFRHYATTPEMPLRQKCHYYARKPLLFTI